MREIKFRARHAVPYLGEWYYGSSTAVEGEDDHILPLSLFWLQVEKGVLDKNTVGEYTDRKDKNGKKIHEGDIVKVFPTFIDGDTQKVWWSDRIYGFAFGGYALPQITFDKTFEVIGNIYENPELLEVKDGPSSK